MIFVATEENLKSWHSSDKEEEEEEGRKEAGGRRKKKRRKGGGRRKKRSWGQRRRWRSLLCHMISLDSVLAQRRVPPTQREAAQRLEDMIDQP